MLCYVFCIVLYYCIVLCTVGILGAALNGFIWPSFAFLFGEILDVFALPPDQILGEIHMWAGLFVVLGVVSGSGILLKVGI